MHHTTGFDTDNDLASYVVSDTFDIGDGTYTDTATVSLSLDTTQAVSFRPPLPHIYGGYQQEGSRFCRGISTNATSSAAATHAVVDWRRAEGEVGEGSLVEYKKDQKSGLALVTERDGKRNWKAVDTRWGAKTKKRVSGAQGGRWWGWGMRRGAINVWAGRASSWLQCHTSQTILCLWNQLHTGVLPLFKTVCRLAWSFSLRVVVFTSGD